MKTLFRGCALTPALDSTGRRLVLVENQDSIKLKWRPVILALKTSLDAATKTKIMVWLIHMNLALLS
jgi:hypothetical protein